MDKKHQLCISLLFILMSFGIGYPQTIEQFSKFGDMFLKSGDYYLAVGEYKKSLLLLHESYSQQESEKIILLTKISYCYLQGKKWDVAVTQLNKIPDSLKTSSILYLSGYGKYKLKNYTGSKLDLEKAEQKAKCFDEKAKSILLQGMIGLDVMDLNYSRNQFTKVLYDSTSSRSIRMNVTKIINHIDNYRTLSPKSYVAAGLFGIIPGVGHIYAEHFTEGMQVILINSIFDALCVGSWYNELHYKSKHNRNYTLPAITTTVSSILYISNIYSAIACAKRFNIARRIELLEAAKTLYVNLSINKQSGALSFFYNF